MIDDERQNSEKQNETNSDVSRRDFIAMSVAAGIVAATGSASAAMPVSETDVTIKTPDGMCDAAFIHPTTGSHPGVIIWADAFGLRPTMRDIGKRIAAEGYSVLVPNPFYRVAKAPVLEEDKVRNFNFQTDMPKIQPLMASINAPGAAEKDAAAFVAFLDAQKEVNKSKKIGTQGYCMGGPLVVKTCAAAPNRVGAGGSFHGGGLVTDKPDSPHLLASKIKARMYFGSPSAASAPDSPSSSSLSGRRLLAGCCRYCRWRAKRSYVRPLSDCSRHRKRASTRSPCSVCRPELAERTGPQPRSAIQPRTRAAARRSRAAHHPR